MYESLYLLHDAACSWTFGHGSSSSPVRTPKTAAQALWVNVLTCSIITVHMLRKWISFWHFVLSCRSQQYSTSRNAAPAPGDDALSSLLLLFADLVGKLRNACNNNHVLWERISWLIKMFCLLLEKAPLGDRLYQGSLLWIHFIFTFVFNLPEQATMFHYLLAETQSLGYMPWASVNVSTGSDEIHVAYIKSS